MNRRPKTGVSLVFQVRSRLYDSLLPAAAAAPPPSPLPPGGPLLACFCAAAAAAPALPGRLPAAGAAPPAAAAAAAGLAFQMRTVLSAPPEASRLPSPWLYAKLQIGPRCSEAVARRRELARSQAISVPLASAVVRVVPSGEKARLLICGGGEQGKQAAQRVGSHGNGTEWSWQASNRETSNSMHGCCVPRPSQSACNSAPVMQVHPSGCHSGGEAERHPK